MCFDDFLILDYRLSYNLKALKLLKSFKIAFKLFNFNTGKIIHLNLKIDLFALYEFIIIINLNYNIYNNP